MFGLLPFRTDKGPVEDPLVFPEDIDVSNELIELLKALLEKDPDVRPTIS